MIKGITEFLAVTAGSESFGFFPLPSVPGPEEGWLHLSYAKEEVVLQSAACGIFCEMAVTSAKLSPSVSWLMVNLRLAVSNIFVHRGALENLFFGLSFFFFF